jgi:capsular exopolysaccharide synthesis family protein
MKMEPAVARLPRVRTPRPPAQSAEVSELVIHWRALAKRKWWIVATAIAFAAIAMFALSFVTPVYRATVTLLIESSKAKLVSIEEVYSGISPNREHYQTQAEILKLPALATRVIEKLRLSEHPEFDPRQRQPAPFARILGLRSRAEPVAWTPEKLEAAILAEFLRRVTLEPVRLTQLVRLSFDSSDPQLAARIANSIAELYIDTDNETRSAITRRAGDSLAERLVVLKDNLERSEQALQRYREQQGLLETKGLAQSGSAKQIEELTTALNEATQKRIEAESNHRQLRSANGGAATAPLVLRAAHVDRLKEIESAAERNVAMLANRYGPEHPRMIHAERQLAEARRSTKKAIDAVIASAGREYELAAAEETATREALNAAKTSVRDLNRKEFRLESLEQDVATNREIYEKFLNRYRETRATSDIDSGAVARVIDPAVAPLKPYSPRTDRISQFAFVIGLLLAGIGAIVRERMDSTIRSVADVEEKLGLPLVAVLPLLRGSEAGKTGRYYLERPASIYAEAIRTARTGIMLSAIDSPSKILVVSSSVPGEGKSSFAANLAVAHAEGRRTLLIEADLRRPTVAAHLHLPPDVPGLVDLLTGRATMSQCIQRAPGSSLYVMPAGSSADAPLELLCSGRFGELIERLAKACDIVIIDSPPVHVVSDPAVLARLSTGILFVVKAGTTPYALARRSIRTLESAGATVVGIALNQLDFRDADRYYGNYTRYAKQYGALPGRVT